MGILDKVMFWKRQDDFSFDKGFDSAPGSFGGVSALGKTPGASGLGTRGAEHLGLSNAGMELQGEEFVTAPGLESVQKPMPTLEPVRNEPQQVFGRDSMAKELEIVSAKLDSIRASIESLNVRVGSIERVMRSEYETKHDARW